jgi:hypothetical protein
MSKDQIGDKSDTTCPDQESRGQGGKKESPKIFHGEAWQ